MRHDCDKLESFLSNELLGADTLRFEAHVVECETCRELVDQQRWIDGLLRSAERFELEPAPTGIDTKIRHTIIRRRNVQLAACGFAAAATLFVAAGWIFVLNRQARDAGAPVLAQAVTAHNEPSPGPSLKGRGMVESPRAVFVGGSDVFVAAVESRSPNVTIIRLYPTYKPSLASNSSAESSDADEFNGG